MNRGTKRQRTSYQTTVSTVEEGKERWGSSKTAQAASRNINRNINICKTDIDRKIYNHVSSKQLSDNEKEIMMFFMKQCMIGNPEFVGAIEFINKHKESTDRIVTLTSQYYMSQATKFSHNIDTNQNSLNLITQRMNE
tara:strand:- start:8 stop:421 length:414 start_codon:yes stop_codon:yes gene_type:complete